MPNYANLLSYCKSDRQIEIFQGLIKHNSQNKTAQELNINISSVKEIVARVKNQASKQGYDPEHDMTHPIPMHMGLQRVSTNYDDEGNVRSQWVISKPGAEDAEQGFRAFCKGLTDEIAPLKPAKKPKGKFNNQLLAAIVIGDAHLGSLAHKEDNLKEDFNIDIATKDLRNAIDYLVDQAPMASEGMLINVGDFCHIDNAANTTTGGTGQDTSARHTRILRIAGATLRYAIDKMATKFPKVRVVNAAGNHDMTSAIALSMFLEGLYEKDKRVIVEPTESKFYFLEFGKNLIGVTHGDKIPFSRLAGVMTRLASEQWGRTKYRRWIIGHYHHSKRQEMDLGVTVEVFNSLAETDAWHSSSGYGGERVITCITYHKEFGEIGRNAPSLEMIRAHAA